MSEQKKTVKKKKKQKRKMTPFLRLICYLIIAASVFLLVEVDGLHNAAVDCEHESDDCEAEDDLQNDL